MSIARSVADVLRDHVVLELEAIDRMYLNVYVPHLQTVGAVVGYLRVHRGQRFASTTAVTPMTEAFIRKIEQFVADESVDLVTFEKGQRKDDVTQKYLPSFRKSEGGRVRDTTCLITDVRLPGMNGVELQARLISDGHCMPTIFVKSFTDDAIQSLVLRAGAICYLSKPLQEHSLLACVERALKHSGQDLT